METDSRRPWMHPVLILSAMLFALPILVMVFSSFKSPEQLARDPYSLLPDQWNVANYPEAIERMPFLLYLTNTLTLCIGCVVGTTLSCAFVAYALARMKWVGRRTVMSLVLVTMLLPWHVTMIPRFWIIREVGLYDSLGAIILPCFLGNAFFIFLLRQFFLTIPQELMEAGRIDGMNDWTLFWRIVIPMSRPAIVTVALFQVIETWNDFNGPLLFLNDPQKFPLAYGLERFISSYTDQTHLLLAASVVFTLPMVILFFLAQRSFIQGISTTGIKG